MKQYCKWTLASTPNQPASIDRRLRERSQCRQWQASSRVYQNLPAFQRQWMIICRMSGVQTLQHSLQRSNWVEIHQEAIAFIDILNLFLVSKLYRLNSMNSSPVFITYYFCSTCHLPGSLNKAIQFNIKDSLNSSNEIDYNQRYGRTIPTSTRGSIRQEGSWDSSRRSSIHRTNWFITSSWTWLRHHPFYIINELHIPIKSWTVWMKPTPYCAKLLGSEGWLISLLTISFMSSKSVSTSTCK